jgi:uncharacterized protein
VHNRRPIDLFGEGAASGRFADLGRAEFGLSETSPRTRGNYRAIGFLDAAMSDQQRNVFGEPIEVCSLNPSTGFYRTGCCETGPEDVGVHTVCVEVTREFLAFSKARGNDLSTPRPEYGFPGLSSGDRWCLCAARWQEALAAGVAPRVVLSATHEATLEIASLADLKRHALDLA